jgi:CRP-like cAMP-binding protein
MAETVGYDYDYLQQIASRNIEQVKTKINLIKLQKLHPAIRRLVLRLMITRLKGDTRRLTLQHIREIEGLLLAMPLNSIVDLPQGISVKKSKKTILFYHR